MAIAALLVSVDAYGQTFDVKQPEAKQGNLELGSDNSVHWGVPRDRGADVNQGAHDLSLDYGVTDWWRLSGVVKLENPQDAQLRIAKVAIENLLVLKPVDDKRPRDIGLGWFAAMEASVHPDTTNSLVFGPIVTLKSDKVSVTLNPFFEKTFGRNRVEGIALNYGWNVKYEVRSDLAVGVEGFGLIENLGDPLPWSEQEHRIGPAVFTEIALADNFKITPDVGLFFGLTRATPDVTLKFNVGIPLQQR